jgi:hypothetical protein
MMLLAAQITTVTNIAKSAMSNRFASRSRPIRHPVSGYNRHAKYAGGIEIVPSADFGHGIARLGLFNV